MYSVYGRRSGSNIYPKPLMSRVAKAEKLRQKSKQQVLVQRDPLQDNESKEEEAVQGLLWNWGAD